VRQIGSTVEEVEMVDTDERGIGWGESLRVKALIDLSKPLSRKRKLNINGAVEWVPFQYEKLPKFCFRCGVIRHRVMGCGVRNNP
jgi:hypothetical protein